MQDYQSNSKKNRQEPVKPDVTDKPRPEVTKIVVGEVVEPKKSLGSKFKDTFFDGEFYKGLVHQVYHNNVVPNFKRIAYEVGVEALLLGIFRNGNAKQIFDPKNIVQRFSYQTPVSRQGGFPPGMVGSQMSSIGPSQMPQQRAIEMGSPTIMRQDSRRIFVIGSRQEASDVLEAMSDIINSEYKVVSLGEVREMLGLPHTPVDNAWGWYALGDARITQSPDGWILDLPQPEAL